MSLYIVCDPLFKAKFSFLFSHFQLLVQREADLFAENENRETPCDCAEKQHHKELALCLESQMVFSLAPEAEGIEAEYAALDRREVQNNIERGGGYTASTGVIYIIISTKLPYCLHQTVEKSIQVLNNCCRCFR